VTVSPCRSIVLAVALAAGLTGITGCATHRDDTATSSVINGMVPRATGEVPFTYAWELELPGRVERSWVSPTAPELVFFQIAGTHEIHCIDSLSGITKWVSEAFPKVITGDAFVQRVKMAGERENEVRIDERLYFISDDSLYCYDIPTGQRIWHLVLPFAPSTGPLAAGGSEGNLRVFIGDWNNRVQVVALHQSDLEQQRFPYVIWQMNLDATILSQGVESEGLSYFGDNSGHVRSFKLDRNQVWSIPTGGAIEGGVTVRDRILYAGNEGNTVHAFNRLTGEHLGQFNLQGPVRQRPFWFTGERQRLYAWIASDEPQYKGLVALKAQPDNIPYAEGNRQALEVVRLGQDWFLPGPSRLVTSTPLHLLVSNEQQTLLWAVHRGTGQVEWLWDLDKGWPNHPQGKPAKVDHVVATVDPRDELRTVIAADESGKVYAFRALGFIPTPEQQATGVTSRAIANKAAAPKDAKDDKAPAKPAKDKAPAADAKSAEKPAE
jgi:hypothetical protein